MSDETFPVGSLRVVESRKGDARRNPDGTFEVTRRFTSTAPPRSEREQFEARLADDPRDAGLRLTFADWLEEAGEAEFAVALRSDRGAGLVAGAKVAGRTVTAHYQATLGRPFAAPRPFPGRPGYIPAYWTRTGRYELEAAELHKLVPHEGAAGTPAGEVFRCAQNLYYDRFNNGGWNVRNALSEQADYLASLQRPLEVVGRELRVRQFRRRLSAFVTGRASALASDAVLDVVIVYASRLRAE